MLVAVTCWPLPAVSCCDQEPPTRLGSLGFEDGDKSTCATLTLYVLNPRPETPNTVCGASVSWVLKLAASDPCCSSGQEEASLGAGMKVPKDEAGPIFLLRGFGDGR